MVVVGMVVGAAVVVVGGAWAVGEVLVVGVGVGAGPVVVIVVVGWGGGVCEEEGRPNQLVGQV